MKNTVKKNVKKKSIFSTFQKVEIAKKQLKSVKGGATDIVIEDVIES